MTPFFTRLAVTLSLASFSFGSDVPNGGMPYGSGGSYAPWAPANLSPYQAWWNGNLCFSFNQSTACPPNYLNQTGKIYVNSNQTQQFCAPTCLSVQFNQTLDCIYKVTKYNQSLVWKFMNGATIWQLNSTVHSACQNLTSGSPGNFTVPVAKK